MIRVTQAIPLAEYRLTLQFSDDTTGIADLTPLLQKGVFRVLTDQEEFRKVTILHDTVRWENHDLDIAPEYLYKMITGKYPGYVEGLNQ